MPVLAAGTLIGPCRVYYLLMVLARSLCVIGYPNT